MNGKRIACVGAGPGGADGGPRPGAARLSVTVFDGDAKAGGMIRSQIPRFRLPEEVIDEETGYVLQPGRRVPRGTRIESLKALLDEGYDAVFVGSGAPRGRDLKIPGATRPRSTSTSASTGSRRSRSATSRRSRSA
jgi:NADPH-dependent glutamate synthase beta subunit-like oxidoreductase